MSVQLSREELELRKLELEIRELAKPWWQHATYIGMFSAVTLAAVGMAIALWLAYFDRERFHLKNEIDRLQETRKELQEEARKTKIRHDEFLNFIKEQNEEMGRVLGIPAVSPSPKTTPSNP
jgi:hypothetical protein